MIKQHNSISPGFLLLYLFGQTDSGIERRKEFHLPWQWERAFGSGRDLSLKGAGTQVTGQASRLQQPITRSFFIRKIWKYILADRITVQ